MGKVKKRGRVGKSGSGRSGSSRRAPSGTKSKVPARKTLRRKSGARASGRRTPAAKRPVPAVYRLRELDAVAKCGPGTSVRRLFRVDEVENGGVTTHLVFLDRHGWYCEHGRDCPAVSQVRAGTHDR